MKNAATLFNWRSELKNQEADVVGEDFILLDRPIFSEVLKHPIKLDVTASIICIQGSMQGSINLKPYKVKAPFLFVVLAGQIMQYDNISDDFSGHIFLMSNRFLENIMTGPEERVPLYLSVYENPYLPLSETDLELVKEYFIMFRKVIRRKDNPHRLEVLKHLCQAMFYSSVYDYYKLSENKKKTKHEILVEEFLNSVRVNYKQQRKVDYYADKLRLTPKYLSKVIKENSGKTVNDWIDDYVMLEAKALLKSTNMTIQQISDELNFTSQSFFGKYFKRHEGVSPKEYRSI